MKAKITLWASVLLAIFIACDGNNGMDPGPATDDSFYIALTPEQNAILTDSTLVLTVSINSVEDLFAISFDILFDTALVSMDSISIPSSCLLGQNSSVSFYNSIPNGISIGFGRFQTGENDNISGSGSLLSIAFRGLSPGTTNIEFQNVNILDESGSANADLENLETRSAQIAVQ